MDEKHPAHNLFYSVVDPQAPIQNCPAMTTMLFKVCDRDPDKFDEAMRLVGLFMAAAYEKGKSDPQSLYPPQYNFMQHPYHSDVWVWWKTTEGNATQPERVYQLGLDGVP